MYHQLNSHKVYVEGKLDVDNKIRLEPMSHYVKNPYEEISTEISEFIEKLKKWEERIKKISFEDKEQKKMLREKINEVYRKFSKTEGWAKLMKKAIGDEKNRKGLHTKFVAATKDVNNIQRSVIAFKNSNQPELMKNFSFNSNLFGSENEFYDPLLERKREKSRQVLKEELKKKQEEIKKKKEEKIGKRKIFIFFRY